MDFLIRPVREAMTKNPQLISKERLAQLLCDYVTQDAESAEPDYIREVLDDIGMTRKEMEYVGLDWLIPDE